MPPNKDKLVAILTYHVVAGAAVYSKDLKPTNAFKTLQGDDLMVEARSNGVFVNSDTKVIAADNAASNGVVHIIDTVVTPPGENIVELAVSLSELSTLVTALKAGGLVGALGGKGPFTVFAPNNAAFAKLPSSTLASLLKPENKDKLVSILKYHVVAGAALYSKDLKPKNKIKSLEGEDLIVERSLNGVTVNKNADVIMADKAASNGVVHILDTVLMPPGKNIVDLAVSVKSLSTLVTALKAGGLVSALTGKGPFTVFAPNNAAFAKLPSATLKSLLKPENKDKLVKILTYHVVAGAVVHSKDLKAVNAFTTIEGRGLLVESRKDGVFVNSYSKVIAADNDASNGVAHIIDTVLIIDKSWSAWSALDDAAKAIWNYAKKSECQGSTCSSVHINLFKKMSSLKGKPSLFRKKGPAANPTVQFEMSDTSRVTLIYTPTKDRKIELTEIKLAGSSEKCEDKTELDPKLAMAYKTLTGEDPTCANALVNLGKYGFKCDDDLSGLFGVDFKLNDFCCASCNPKPTCKDTCGLPEYKGDGNCDDKNNNCGCEYDGGDCCGPNVKKSYCSECKCLDPNYKEDTSCTGTCGAPKYKGDGNCDDENNNCGCGYDGGDCCAKTVKGGKVKKTYCKACACLDPNGK